MTHPGGDDDRELRSGSSHIDDIALERDALATGVVQDVAGPATRCIGEEALQIKVWCQLLLGRGGRSPD